MLLRRLAADRLRNLKQVELDLSDGLTMVSGRNGQGKTSLLEAAYALGTGRSFRTRQLDELIAWDGGPMRVAGVVENRAGETALVVAADGTDRRLTVDRAECDLESYLGRLDVVDLTAGRMLVLRGPPVERRRFLDRGVVGLQPSFLRVLGEYRRVLGHRNALLRSAASGAGPPPAAELAAWNERLVEAATRVHAGRRDYATGVVGALEEAERALFPGGERLEVRYRSSPAVEPQADDTAFSAALAEALDRGRGRDLGQGFTGEGPHRDDLAVLLEGVDLRRFGSAGQARAAVIVLKLAKLNRLLQERGETPLFLMDDFDTDLDEPRARDLAGFLHRGGCQALVASSKERMTEGFELPFHAVRMEGGMARA